MTEEGVVRKMARCLRERDPAAALRAYDAGEFVYAPRPREHYGMALISEDYARRHWQGWLTLRRYVASWADFGQNILVAQKS